MNTKIRIYTIRLIEKLKNHPKYSEKLQLKFDEVKPKKRDNWTTNYEIMCWRKKGGDITNE